MGNFNNIYIEQGVLQWSDQGKSVIKIVDN